MTDLCWCVHLQDHFPDRGFQSFPLGGGGGPPQETLSFWEGFFLHMDRVAINLTETPWCQ